MSEWERIIWSRERMRSQNRKLVVGVFDVFVWEGARLNRNRNSAFAKLVFWWFHFWLVIV